MEAKYIDTRTWIRDSLHIIGHKKFYEVVLPGTHNSGSYSFTEELMQGTQSKTIEKLIKIGPKMLRSGVHRLETTQALGIYDQLLLGARYLDIRAGWKDDWRTYHCHIGDKIEDILKSVNEYLDAYDCEVLVIELSHFKVKSDSNLQQLSEIIESTIGPKLFNKRQDFDFTIFEMIESGGRIVLMSDYYPYFHNAWDSSLIHDVYPDKSDVEGIQNHNIQLIQNFKISPQKLLKVSWILTPAGFEATKQLMSMSNLLKAAKEVNRNMLNTLIDGDLENLNILIIDNFGHSEIMKIIYKLNKITL